MTTELRAPMLKKLTSNELSSKLAELRHRERQGLVEFLWYLAEFNRRRVHEDLAYSSLFDYCRRALGMSKGMAFRRTASARLLARFPVVAQYLSDGRLCETTLVLLRKVLTAENHRELLDRAAGKTEDEVKLIVVELLPGEVKKDSIRALPARPAPAPVPVTAPLLDLTPPSSSTPAVAPPPPAAVASPPRPKVEPVTPTLTSIRMTVGAEFMDLLAQVKSAFSHQVPDGNLDALFRICMQRALEQHAQRKHAALKVRQTRAAGSGPKLQPPPATDSEPRIPGSAIVACAIRMANAGFGPKPKRRSRYIPAAVRRAVWERDGGRCTYVAPDGRRCDSTHQLEFDHIDPHALGGKATVDTVRLRCRPHNLHWARRVFGDEHMEQFRRSPESPPPPEIERPSATTDHSARPPPATSSCAGASQ